MLGAEKAGNGRVFRIRDARGNGFTFRRVFPSGGSGRYQEYFIIAANDQSEMVAIDDQDAFRARVLEFIESNTATNDAERHR
jgi:hypothetical protein